MNFFYYFRILYYSFFEKKLYYDLFYKIKNLTFRYIVFLSLLNLIPYILFWFLVIKNVNFDQIKQPNYEYSNVKKNNINVFLNNIFLQVPTIKISDSKIQTLENNPYYIYDLDGSVFIIIDTSDNILDIKNTDALILVNSNKITFRVSESDGVAISINNILSKFSSSVEFHGEDFLLYQEDLINIFEKIWSKSQFFLFFIFLPLIIIIKAIFISFRGLIYSIVGKIYFDMIKAKYQFNDIYRLTIVSLTPSVIFEIAAPLAVLLIPMSSKAIYLITVILSIGYFIFAIKSCKDNITTNM